MPSSQIRVITAVEVRDRPTLRALKVWKTQLAIQPQLGESSRGNMHLQKDMLQTNHATVQLSINGIEIQQVLFRNSSSTRHLVDEVGSKSASNTVVPPNNTVDHVKTIKS